MSMNTNRRWMKWGTALGAAAGALLLVSCSNIGQWADPANPSDQLIKIGRAHV